MISKCCHIPISYLFSDYVRICYAYHDHAKEYAMNLNWLIPSVMKTDHSFPLFNIINPQKIPSSDLTATQFCGSLHPLETSKKCCLVSIALVVRQTEVTGYTSHLFHLALAIHCHSFYQSVLKPHRSWGRSARETCSAGGSSPNRGYHSKQKFIGWFVLSCYGLVFLGAPLTPQSTLSLTGSLTGFLLQTCLKIFAINLSFFMNCFSKKFALTSLRV